MKTSKTVSKCPHCEGDHMNYREENKTHIWTMTATATN